MKLLSTLTSKEYLEIDFIKELINFFKVHWTIELSPKKNKIDTLEVKTKNFLNMSRMGSNLELDDTPNFVETLHISNENHLESIIKAIFNYGIWAGKNYAFLNNKEMSLNKELINKYNSNDNYHMIKQKQIQLKLRDLFFNFDTPYDTQGLLTKYILKYFNLKTCFIKYKYIKRNETKLNAFIKKHGKELDSDNPSFEILREHKYLVNPLNKHFNLPIYKYNDCITFISSRKGVKEDRHHYKSLEYAFVRSIYVYGLNVGEHLRSICHFTKDIKIN